MFSARSENRGRDNLIDSAGTELVGVRAVKMVCWPSVLELLVAVASGTTVRVGVMDIFTRYLVGARDGEGRAPVTTVTR